MSPKLLAHVLDHVLGNSTDLLLSGHIRVGQDLEVEPLVHVDHLRSNTLELGAFLGRTIVVLAPDQVQHGLDTNLEEEYRFQLHLEPAGERPALTSAKCN
jgi:hypothetical protein